MGSIGIHHHLYNDIDFSLWIKYNIHERSIQEITSISFPYFIQRLYDKVEVSLLQKIDHRIEVTQMTSVGIIHNVSNPVIVKKA